MNRPDSSASNALVSRFEAVIACLAAAAILSLTNAPRMHKGLASFLIMRITVENVILGSVLLLAWKPCFRGFENSLKRRDPIPLVMGQMFRGATLVSLLLAAILYVARVQTPALPVIPCFWFANVFLLSLKVLMSRWLLSAPWRHRNQVLILGTGAIARHAWRELRTIHHRYTKVVGFVDVSGSVETYPEISASYLGNITELENLLLTTVVDTIVIAIPAKSCYGAIETALEVSEKVGIDVVFSRPFGSASGPQPLFHSRSDDSSETPYLTKRMVDLFVSFTSILLLTPLLVAIALALKLTSPGPVVVGQERYGLRRRRFKLYRFRTTAICSQPTPTHVHKKTDPSANLAGDMPPSALGRFLRRSHLDDMPQLWNVLTGSMSLVGPRPMTNQDVSQFSHAHLIRRFRAKPGITGLWQINSRNSLSYDQLTDAEFRYLDNWSLKLDLFILLQSIPFIFRDWPHSKMA